VVFEFDIMSTQKYAVIELQKKDGQLHVWGCIVGDEKRPFSLAFERVDANTLTDTLEELVRAACLHAGCHEEGIAPLPQFVVWQKDDLLMRELLGVGSDLVIATRLWVDFLSYYAGIRGLTLLQAKNELRAEGFTTVGPARAQRLAVLLGALLRITKSHREIVSAAAQIAGVREGMMDDPALQNLFSNK